MSLFKYMGLGVVAAVVVFAGGYGLMSLVGPIVRLGQWMWDRYGDFGLILFLAVPMGALLGGCMWFQERTSPPTEVKEEDMP